MVRPRAAMAVTWHNALSGRPARRPVHGLLERLVARASRLTWAVSPDLAERARQAGAGDVRTLFVPAPRHRQPARSVATRREGLGTGQRPLVVAVGRLEPQKRFDVVIDAAAAWRDDRQGPRVVIAGTGKRQPALEAQIRRTRAPVRLLGYRTDVSELVAAADVAVVSSAWEGCPLIVQEVLRAGTPLVATRVGGIPDLVGEAAVLVPPEDSGALRQAIEQVLTDAALAGRLRSAGPQRAATWPTVEHVVSEIAASYLDLA
jgi:glycosyltransferase involved in cell wall biosynthesis